MRKLTARALIATGLLFAVCWLAAPSGSFMPRLTTGYDICDYRFFISKCLAEERPYRPETIPARDACYPPIAYCLVRCFPLTPCGEDFYVSFLFLGLFAGLVFFLRQRHYKLMCAGVMVLTMPFAAGPLRGNPSAWAAGSLFVYLAWFDAEKQWKRMVAAGALGLAVALKITPVVCGLLYLRGCLFTPEKWPKEEMIVGAMSFVMLFAVPFMFFGGPNEVDAWLENALANAEHYSRVADFGLVPVVASLRRFMPYQALGLAVRLTTVVAVLFCLVSCFARRFYHALTLLGAALVFLCHHDYGLVYLLPAFACWMCEVRPGGEMRWLDTWVLSLEALMWFLVFESAICVATKEVFAFNVHLACNGAVIMLGALSFSQVVMSWLGCGLGKVGGDRPPAFR